MRVKFAKACGCIGVLAISAGGIGLTLVSRSVNGAVIISAVAGVKIPEAELSQLKEQALRGDGPSSAAKVSRHFSIAGETEESAYWFRLALENGDIETQQEYSVRLWTSGGPRNCKRGLFLMSRITQVRTANADLAREYRQQYQQMQNTLDACVARVCTKEIEGAWCK